MTAFAAEEAKVVVHSSLLLLLGQLAVLFEFRGEVGLVAVGRAGRWLCGVVVIVGVGVVFPVVHLAVGLVDLSDLSALLEQAAFLRLISE